MVVISESGCSHQTSTITFHPKIDSIWLCSFKREDLSLQTHRLTNTLMHPQFTKPLAQLAASSSSNLPKILDTKPGYFLLNFSSLFYLVCCQLTAYIPNRSWKYNFISENLNVENKKTNK